MVLLDLRRYFAMPAFIWPSQQSRRYATQKSERATSSKHFVSRDAKRGSRNFGFETNMNNVFWKDKLSHKDYFAHFSFETLMKNFFEDQLLKGLFLLL